MAAGDDVPVDELKKLEVDADDDTTPGYKAPAKVDLETLKNLDADDESLRKYKAELLKGSGETLDEGGSNVLVKELIICIDGHEDKVLDLTGDLKAFALHPVQIKEGSKYTLKIKFRVQREIVAGLRFANVIRRKGIAVEKGNHMVGSYGPKPEAYLFTAKEEETPKGMLARGSYIVKSKFLDDDKNVYLEWDWTMNITKK